jgi:hypothetical protein
LVLVLGFSHCFFPSASMMKFSTVFGASLSKSLASISPWFVAMRAYTPGPCFAEAGGAAVSDAGFSAAAEGFSVDGAGVSAGGAGFSVGAAGVGAGAGVVAGGSDGRAGSGAPHPAAANVSAHTKPTIHLVIGELSLSLLATSYELPATTYHPTYHLPPSE